MKIRKSNAQRNESRKINTIKTSSKGTLIAMNARRTTSDFLFAHGSFATGLARLVDFGCTFDNYNVSRSPAEADTRAAVSDWLSVGDDLHAAIARVDDKKNAA